MLERWRTRNLSELRTFLEYDGLISHKCHGRGNVRVSEAFLQTP